jgi:hypothetical protein
MNGTLIGRGRDTEDQDLALQFSKETCRWTILGQAADVRRTEHKGRVLVALEEAGGTGLSPKEISDEVDELSHGNARQLLRRMAQAREVQADRGRYFHNSVSLSKTLVTLSPGPVTAEGVCKKPGNQPCSLEETGDSDTVTAFTDNVTSAHTPAPAVDFLLWALKPGQRLVRDIEASARAEGLLGERQRIDNAKAFRQAKQVLQLVVEREGFGPGSKVYWRLPDDVVSTDTTSEPEAGDQ